MPPVNSSINFLMVSSCLTTLLFLALTLPAPDSYSMVACSPKSTAVVAHWLNNVIGIDTSRQAHIRAGFVTYFFRHELKLKSRSNFVKLQILMY